MLVRKQELKTKKKRGHFFLGYAKNKPRGPAEKKMSCTGGEDAARQLKRLREEIEEQGRRNAQRLEELARVVESTGSSVSPTKQQEALDRARAATSGTLAQFDEWSRRIYEVRVYLNAGQIKDLVTPGSAFNSKPNIGGDADYYTRTRSILVFMSPETKHTVQLRYEHNGACNPTNMVIFVSDSHRDGLMALYRSGSHLEHASTIMDSRFGIRRRDQSASFIALLGEFTREYLNAIGVSMTNETYSRLLAMQV